MKLTTATLLSLFSSAICAGTVFFEERFDDANVLGSRWKLPKSSPKNSEREFGKWEISAGNNPINPKIQTGLRTTEDSHFYAITSALPTPVTTEGKKFILQYTVKHEQNIDCGGGYIKLLHSDINPDHFSGETPYALMFGPDICGFNRRIHVIWNYKGKNHLIKKDIPPVYDDLTHLYTLLVNPDNTYEVRIDQKSVAKGTLQDDWNMLEPRMIPDPQVEKPADWDDREDLPDPDDKKPADWDLKNPLEIPDSKAEKPADWDDTIEEWSAPLIPNPNYREWKQKHIPNPNYKGEWSAPLIPNPGFKDDPNMYILKDIGYVGFDLWQVKSGSIFDNILLTDSVEKAEAIAKEVWEPCFAKEEEDREEREKKRREEMELRWNLAQKEREEREAAKARGEIIDDVQVQKQQPEPKMPLERADL